MIPLCAPSQLSQLCVKLHLYICAGAEVGCSPVFYLQNQCCCFGTSFGSGVPVINLLYKLASFNRVLFILNHKARYFQE